MRIAMVGPFGLEPRMTMRARAFELAKHLVQAGHQVTIVMPPIHTPELAGRRWAEESVQLEYVTLGPTAPALAVLPITCRLLRAVRTYRPDILHVFKPIGHAGAAARLHHLTRRPGVRLPPLVVDQDDWEGRGGWSETSPHGALARKVIASQEGWALRHASAVTVASTALQSLAWSLARDARNVYYLPNGPREWPTGDGAATRTRLGVGAAPLVLLYTRFFEFDVERAAETFRLIREQRPDVRLLVVGTGLRPADEERFYGYLEARGLGAHVIRAGWAPAEELPGYFAAANVALYPFDDTLINRCKCPVKLTDLLYAGVPVVAEAVGEISVYIQHKQSGLLVQPGHPEALAQAALELLGDTALAGSLARAAAADMRTRYAWRSRAAQLEKIYARLLGHAR